MLEIKENEPLKNHTSFRIGGPAKYFVAVKNSLEVQEAIDWAITKQINFKVIGGGSNLLIADNGFNGLIIKYFGGEISLKDETIEVGAGVPLVLAMNKSLAAGLVGLEWAIGIPGTIGGAICNNAGAYGGEMADSVVLVKVLSNHQIKEISGKDCGFSYRDSRFKTDVKNDIILSAELKLKSVSAEELAAAKQKMQVNLADRLTKSAEGGSAGSTFRNVILTEEEMIKFKNKFPELPDKFADYKKVPAAWLIEECGLKGKRIGGAMVSEKHAGKITNIDEATAEQVIMLISVVKQKVRSKFSLQLMEEVEYVGF